MYIEICPLEFPGSLAVKVSSLLWQGFDPWELLCAVGTAKRRKKKKKKRNQSPSAKHSLCQEALMISHSVVWDPVGSYIYLFSIKVGMSEVQTVAEGLTFIPISRQALYFGLKMYLGFVSALSPSFTARSAQSVRVYLMQACASRSWG